MGLYRGWRGGGGGSVPPVFPGSAYARGLCLCMCLLNVSVCLFVCLSLCQSVCLAKSLYMYMPACLHVSHSPPLSPSLSLSLSLCLTLSICGVDLSDQRSHARYRAIQVFSWDSKSVPFPINLS